jgi:hypothetical protein
LAIAVTRPVLGFCFGVSELTTPTRVPAIRTWLEGLGERDFDVVGGHERKPVVGVIGQKHGDDHDQRRDGPDQERAGGEGVAAAAVHQGC